MSPHPLEAPAPSPTAAPADEPTLPEEADVVIVGAGPGGATLALLLARSGVRTVLVERHARLDREFRGFFFHPLAVRLLDEMGALEGILRLPHARVDPLLVARGETPVSAWVDALLPAHAFGLTLAQAPLLQHLLDEASRFPGFAFVPSAAAKALLRDAAGAVVGVTVKRGASERDVRARLVVGADGRFSAVRKLLGVAGVARGAPVDLAWFELPDVTGPAYPRQVPADGGTLVQVPMGCERLRVGWTVPRGGFAALQAEGIAAFRERLARADPTLRAPLERHLADFSRVTVLETESSVAERWVADGALLLGDAAHVLPPFSGRGNTLAIEDAVVAHAVVVRALAQAPDGALPAEALRAFEDARRPAVAEAERVLAAPWRLDAAREPLLGILPRLRPRLAPLVERARVPLRRQSGATVRVDTTLFADGSARAGLPTAAAARA